MAVANLFHNTPLRSSPHLLSPELDAVAVVIACGTSDTKRYRTTAAPQRRHQSAVLLTTTTAHLQMLNQFQTLPAWHLQNQRVAPHSAAVGYFAQTPTRPPLPHLLRLLVSMLLHPSEAMGITCKSQRAHAGILPQTAACPHQYLFLATVPCMLTHPALLFTGCHMSDPGGHTGLASASGDTAPDPSRGGYTNTIHAKMTKRLLLPQHPNGGPTTIT